MVRDKQYTFKLTEEELAMIDELAEDEERTRADMLRRLIRRAYAQLKAQEKK